MNKFENLTEEQQKYLLDAFKAVVSLNTAETFDNHSRCATFHIKPFHKDWDEETVKGVIQELRLYVSTWILYPLAVVVGIDPEDVTAENLIYWHRLQANGIEYRLKEKTKKNENAKNH